ncbi:MAG TPA: Type 1 glutamine amidotransferase-like domain-containing protein [Pseudomonadales bacterium]|nr:Type 1 glutamine amidotransferase-like domain-containing protein [Pseudomonadales bacterium]
MFYLLADSTALFKPSSLCLSHLSKRLGRHAKIAYVGAANGDVEEYFELFRAAVQSLQPSRIIHVRFPFEDAALQQLADSDLVVLAGGDVAAGWTKFADVRFQSVCADLFARGCSWMGVSAGAVHLGAGFMGALPWFIGAHEEANQWRETLAAYHQFEFSGTGIGCLGLMSGAAVFVGHEFEMEILAGQILWLNPDEGGAEYAKS